MDYNNEVTLLSVDDYLFSYQEYIDDMNKVSKNK